MIQKQSKENTKLRGYETLKELKKEKKIDKDAVKVKCSFDQWWCWVNMLISSTCC